MVVVKEIKFNIKVSSFVDNISQVHFHIVRSLDIFEIDIFDDEDFTCVYIAENSEMDKLITIFETLGVIDKITDFTDDFNTGKFVIDEFEMEELLPFLSNKITMNEVLDKISKLGIDSITKVDKHILSIA